jgi:hypothetical protein
MGVFSSESLFKVLTTIKKCYMIPVSLKVLKVLKIKVYGDFYQISQELYPEQDGEFICIEL